MGYFISPWTGTLTLTCRCKFCDAVSETESQVWLGSAMIFPDGPPRGAWEKLIFKGEQVWSCGKHRVETTVTDA